MCFFCQILTFVDNALSIRAEYYYMARRSRGKSKRCDWFLLGRDFVTRTVSTETVISRVFFVFDSRQIQNLQLKREPHNNLLTNLACLSRTVEYWPSVVCVRALLRLARIATTLGQCSPVRLSKATFFMYNRSLLY